MLAETIGFNVGDAEGGRLIRMDEGEAEGRRQQMQCCLAGRIEGRSPSINFLHFWGKKLWKILGELKGKRIPNNLFLFVFPSKVEANKVLKERKNGVI